ncbi:TPA: tetratricopeptide repeat protein, partial [Candidatus Poribacteria bacterium]|nr:tetratricopeptide repeat protein [Candidatus Poribacteria bacterium]
LAALLIRYGVLDEAVTVLGRAERMASNAVMLYQIGAAYAEINEWDRAIKVFQRILDMPKPAISAQKPKTTAPIHHGLTPASVNRFLLPRNLANQIRRGYEIAGLPWTPSDFYEAQAGALVQIVMISAIVGRLDDLIGQIEAKAKENPKDLKILERLTQIYMLMEENDKALEVARRMALLSPEDPTYQYLTFTLSLRRSDDESAERALKKLREIDRRTWFSCLATYISNLENRGMSEKAQEMLSDIQSMEIKSPQSGLMLVISLAQAGKVELARRILEGIPVSDVRAMAGSTRIAPFPTVYIDACQALITAYLREGKVKEVVDLLWEALDRTKPGISAGKRLTPSSYTPFPHSGYTPLGAQLTSPNLYYGENRMRLLREIFMQLWNIDRLDLLYAKFQAEFDRAKGRDRIFPGLALSYFYWWEGKRGKSQEVLAQIQKENPDDLILKLNAAFAFINTGKQRDGMDLLSQIAEEDPKNRSRYYDLILRLATFTGDMVKVREVLSKLLNSYVTERELYQCSQRLQREGLTRYAIAAAKKAMKLAMWRGDPNFMMELARHLEKLGRGQDAAILAERAVRISGRYSRMIGGYYYRQALNLIRGSRASKEREARLIKIAEENPNSFRAQLDMAFYYESTKQFDKASMYFERALNLRPKDINTRMRYARTLAQAGKFAEAVEQYTTLLRKSPNVIGYNYWDIVDLFLRAGKVDELVSLAKDMIRPTPGSNFGLYFARTVARRCLENNRPKEAVEIYERILRINPNDSYICNQLATAYASAGKREKAIQLIRGRLESDDPTLSQNPRLRSELVTKLMELYEGSGDLTALAEEYEVKLASKPDDRFLNYLVALLRIKRGEIEGADPLIERLMGKAETIDTSWLFSLANAYRKVGDKDREIRLLERAMEEGFYRSYKLSQIYERLGMLYVRSGDKEGARRAFRKMAGITLMMDNNPWNKRRLADLFRQNEMWDEAKAIYMEVMNDPLADQFLRDEARRQLAEIERRKSGMSATTRIERKASQMSPGVKRSLAQQYMQRNELDRAKKLLLQIVKEVPEDFESQRMLAQIYLRQGEHEKAIAQWKALLNVDPENTKYQDGLIEAYQSAGRFDEALKLIQEYLRENPDSFNYARLGRFYTSCGRIEDAIQAYRQSIKLNPGDRRIHQELAQLYLRKGDFVSAEQILREALKYTSQDWEQQRIRQQIMEIYRRQGKLEEMLQKAEREGRMTSDMWQERARYYLSRGDLEKAADSYRKAMDMATQSWDRENIAYELIKIYVRLGRDDEAIELYERISGTSSTTSISISIIGSNMLKVQFGDDRVREVIITAYRDQGRLEDLLRRVEEKLEEKPEDPSLLRIAAEIYRAKEEHAKAAEVYSKLCELTTMDPLAFYYAAAEFNRWGRRDKALEMVRKGKMALSLSNRRRDIYLLAGLGFICLEGKLYEAAIKLFEDAIARASSHWGGSKVAMYRGLAQSYLGAKRYEDAIRSYQQMANLAQNEIERREAEEMIRKVYKEAGMYDKLIAKYLQATKDNPGDSDAYYSLGRIYEWNEMYDEAIKAYKRADELSPDNKIILESLAKAYLARGEGKDLREVKRIYKRLIELADTANERIRKRDFLADLYSRSGEVEAAISELKKAALRSSSRSERNAALTKLKEICFETKREREVIAFMEEIEPQMKDNAAFYELLGDAYMEIGEREKAKAAYTRWIELREKKANRSGNAWDYDILAHQILDKGIMPQKALELAKVAYNLSLNYYSPFTLVRAYLANGDYNKAIEKFKEGLNRPGVIEENLVRQMWSEIMKSAKILEDEQRFTQVVMELAKLTPEDGKSKLYTDIAMAGFYKKRGDEEKARAYMNGTGFIMEDAWWIIGPFDNSGGMGYEREFIPEEAVQIDPEAKYQSLKGKVKWQKLRDKVFDGFVDLDEIFGGKLDWVTAYAFTTVRSPEERKAQMRIGSDDQIKIWLNGKLVFTYDGARAAAIDQNTVTVTLKRGENSILVKVCDEMEYWGFYLRFTDMDGNPLPVNRP